MKKLRKRIFSLLLVAVASGAFLWGSWKILEQNHVIWNGVLLPRHEQTICITGKRMRNPQAFLKFTDLRQLDARGTEMTLEQYNWFRRELPRCQVLWDVPIQGSYYSQDTRELQVQALTVEEVDSLQYLPQLQLLDVRGWEDYTQIQALRQQYPDCTIRYQVQLGGEWWDSDVASLILENADPQPLMEKLSLFDHLESVLFTGIIPDQAALQQLQETYPEIFFFWKLEALGMTLETDIRELDLSGFDLSSTTEVEALLPYLPMLETVWLWDVDLPKDDLLELARKYPDIHFIFEMNLGDRYLCTDWEEIDLSNIPMESTKTVEDLLPAFHDLTKVVMCECGIPSEDMDALNQKYPDIRFVWSVDLGGMLFRTDAVHFTPNRWGLSLDDEDVYALRYCTDMVCVDIGHQIKVTNCDWAAFMPDLKYLVLAETSISDLTPLTGHENLIFLELFLSKVKDYSPLTTCKALEDLNLSYTQGDPAPIGEMTWLKRLWWSGHWLARKQLTDKLPDTYKEFLSLSSTGRGWREGQHYYDMRDFIGMEYMTG